MTANWGWVGHGLVVGSTALGSRNGDEKQAMGPGIGYSMAGGTGQASERWEGNYPGVGGKKSTRSSHHRTSGNNKAALSRGPSSLMQMSKWCPLQHGCDDLRWNRKALPSAPNEEHILGCILLVTFFSIGHLKTPHPKAEAPFNEAEAPKWQFYGQTLITA